MRENALCTAACWLALVVVGCGDGGGKGSGPVIKRWVEGDVPHMSIDGILVHETDPAKQPQPPVVTSPPDGRPPSDAVVLFDGTVDSLQQNWFTRRKDPEKEVGVIEVPPEWKVVDGVLEPVKGVGSIRSKRPFGSCQLHVEFVTPTAIEGEGQERGNSGIFLMENYEIQLLDSYDNETYPDGQAGAIYGRNKPLVNASRAPGAWQTLDIIFHRPRFGEGGKVLERATFTVLHNGVLIHDHYELSGGTKSRGPHAVAPYIRHADKLPIMVQEHGNRVRFRNLWVRELED